jgi:hypothetical protein
MAQVLAVLAVLAVPAVPAVLAVLDPEGREPTAWESPGLVAHRRDPAAGNPAVARGSRAPATALASPVPSRAVLGRAVRGRTVLARTLTGRAASSTRAVIPTLASTRTAREPSTTARERSRMAPVPVRGSPAHGSTGPASPDLVSTAPVSAAPARTNSVPGRWGRDPRATGLAAVPATPVLATPVPASTAKGNPVLVDTGLASTGRAGPVTARDRPRVGAAKASLGTSAGHTPAAVGWETRRAALPAPAAVTKTTGSA